MENVNLYKVGEHYESHYDDDYCQMLYFDADNKKLVQKKWSTAYACPSYYSYPSKSAKQAVEDGTIDKDDLIVAILNVLDDEKSSQLYAQNVIEEYRKPGIRYELPCKVTGGRKYKGEGVLIDVEDRSFDMGYGRKGIQRTARLLTPDNKIAKATDRFVVVTKSAEEISKRIKETIHERAKNKEEFLDTFFKICGGKSGSELSYYCKYSRDSTFPIFNEYEERINNAIAAEEKERSDKHNKWLQDKRARLLQWCETTFAGKNESEIQRICDRIMRKKYGETVAAV